MPSRRPSPDRPLSLDRLLRLDRLLSPDHLPSLGRLGRYRRRSARVLLLDGADRILLLCCLKQVDRPESGHCWITPGGGVRFGERLARTAARELREEIGLVVAAAVLGRPVATTGGTADLGWARGRFREDFFQHRVTEHRVDVSRMERLERTSYRGHRWWTLDELAATDEEVLPLGLSPLVAELLAGRIPRRPVRLPWHH